MFWYTVESDQLSLRDLRTIQDRFIRYQLNAVPGVAEVASIGGHVQQYQIDVDPNRLRAYNLSIGDVVEAVRNSNQNVGGNVLEANGTWSIVRGVGLVASIADLEQNSPLGRVLAAALRNDHATREGAMQQVEAAGAVVANRLSKNLTLLGSIGSIAPLLGLFGTVVGMIAIFASQQGGSNPQELARGISVALYCTAFSIIVAVPAVLMYRHYRRLVDDYLIDMEEQAERLLERVYDTGGRG